MAAIALVLAAMTVEVPLTLQQYGLNSVLVPIIMLACLTTTEVGESVSRAERGRARTRSRPNRAPELVVAH
jgi:hypothetical protein